MNPIFKSLTEGRVLKKNNFAMMKNVFFKLFMLDFLTVTFYMSQVYDTIIPDFTSLSKHCKATENKGLSQKHFIPFPMLNLYCIIPNLFKKHIKII